MQQDIARTKHRQPNAERETSSARIGGHDMKAKGVKDHQRAWPEGGQESQGAREKAGALLVLRRAGGEAADARQIRLEFGATSAGPFGDRPGRAEYRLRPAARCCAAWRWICRRRRIALTGPTAAARPPCCGRLSGRLPLGRQSAPGRQRRLGFMAQDQADLDRSRRIADGGD